MLYINVKYNCGVYSGVWWDPF